MDDGVPTPAGKEKLAVSTVISILQNEKYRGDARLLKTFIEDFLTKKIVKNEGQIPQYYVTESHPAIVSGEVFDMVQAEIAKNRERGKARSGFSCFSERIICGGCGKFFGSKIWNSNSKYRRTVWQCNGRYRERGYLKCQTVHIDEENVKRLFTKALNKIIADPEHYIAALEPIIEMLTDIAALDNEAEVLKERCAGLYAQMEALITENARQLQDQGDCRKRFE